MADDKTKDVHSRGAYQVSRDGLPSGAGTSKINDVADPHPSDEEHYDQIPRPGGAKSEGKDIGPNPPVHDGKPKPRPKNVEDDRS